MYGGSMPGGKEGPHHLSSNKDGTPPPPGNSFIGVDQGVNKPEEHEYNRSANQNAMKHENI